MGGVGDLASGPGGTVWYIGITPVAKYSCQTQAVEILPNGQLIPIGPTGSYFGASTSDSGSLEFGSDGYMWELMPNKYVLKLSQDGSFVAYSSISDSLANSFGFTAGHDGRIWLMQQVDTNWYAASFDPRAAQ